MKSRFPSFRFYTVFLLLLTCKIAFAQLPAIQFYRPYDYNGIKIFEPAKYDTIPFNGIKIRPGGNFTLDFQSIKHQNNATPVYINGKNINQLIPISSGFNLPSANLNFDVQIADGVKINMGLFLSSRSRDGAGFKRAYIQVDKLLMFKSKLVDKLMESITIKTGDYEIDYGDQHFRRTDGGNAMYNPFVENYIMDASTTEIGTEIYFHPKNGIIAMVGLSNGQADPTVVAPVQKDTATGKPNYYAPAFHVKLGFDRQLNKDFRIRITGSVYAQKSGINSVYFGDRSGSHYFYVMENTNATATNNPWSGRFNPMFTEEVRSLILNPFLKYKGLEFFGTCEIASGRMILEPIMRKTIQYAVDLVYRFPEKTKDFWIGARYNSLTGQLPFITNEFTISRTTGSIGWYASKNIMMKLEYVNQQYKDFDVTDIRSGGKFNGFMFETAVGF